MNDVSETSLIERMRALVCGNPSQSEQGEALLDGLCNQGSLPSSDLVVEFDKALQRHALYDAADTLFSTLCDAPQDNMSVLVALAENALADKNFALAAPRWESIVQHDPENPMARIKLARCHLSMRAMDEAEAQLGALEKWTSRPGILHLKADFLRAKGQPRKALDTLDAANTQFPKAIFLKTLRASVIHQLGRWQEAETCLQDLLQDHPDHLGLLQTRARLAFVSRKFDVSYALWQDIQGRQPENPTALLNLIKCLIEKYGGNTPENHLNYILEQMPLDSRWQGQLAILISQRNERQAVRWIDDYVRDTPIGTIKPYDFERLMLRKIGILIRLLPEGTSEDCASKIHEAFAQLLKIRPMNVTIRTALCDALIAEGRVQEAAEQVDLLPDCADSEVSLLRIWKLQHLGDIAAAKAAWAAQQASRPAPQTLPCEPEVLERLDPREIVDRDGMVTLFTVIRNEYARLPWFLDYYRKIGVSRFVVIDDGSSDDSRPYLLRQPDVHLYAAHEPYVLGYAGVRWINHLTKIHATRGWVLYVDVDEALVFPGFEKAGLNALTDHMDRNGQEAMPGFMLDVVGAHAATGAPEPPVRMDGSDAVDFVNSYRYFENKYRSLPTKNCPYMFNQGGLRRHIGALDNLTKTPLFRGGRGIELRFSSHSISPAALSDVTCALLHFKFAGRGLDRFREDLETNARDGICKSRHQSYIARLQKTAGALPLDKACVHRYVDSDQLYQLGLITCPENFKQMLGQET